MTLSSTASRAAYAGNGSTTHFAVPFLFADNSHVIAILRDANGSETPLAENTHYTLTGAGDASGGTLTVITAPVDHTPQTGATLVVRRVVPLTQETDYVENDPFPAEVHERALDLAAMRDQQLDEKVERALKFPVSDSSALVAEIPNSVSRAGKIFGFDAEGDPTVSEIDLDEIDGLFDDAASAAESAAAALASQNAAATSAVAAETARAAAEAIAEGIGFDDFVQISFVDTPYTVTAADRGKMLICDTSAGAITVNMATIAVLGTPTTIGVKKKTGDGNSVTVNFGGSDTDDEGSTGRTIGSVGGLAMHADADTDPDTWVVETFGASAGNLTVDSFSGDGTETTFTLPVNPGSKNNTWVFISGVYQAKDTYEISNTTLTFETAPAAGINNVQVVIGSTLPLGVPADGSVSFDKITSVSVASQSDAEAGTASDKLMTPERTKQAIYKFSKIVQTVFSQDNTSRSTASSSYVSAGNAAEITIVSGSKVRVRFGGMETGNNAGSTATFTVYRNGSALTPVGKSGMIALTHPGAEYGFPFSHEFVDDPGEGTHTYEIYWRTSNSTIFLGRSIGADNIATSSYIVLEEIKN